MEAQIYLCTHSKDLALFKEQYLLGVKKFHAICAYWRIDGNFFKQILCTPWYYNGGENGIHSRPNSSCIATKWIPQSHHWYSHKYNMNSKFVVFWKPYTYDQQIQKESCYSHGSKATRY